MSNVVIAMPVVDGHENTIETLEHLERTASPALTVVIFDNASDKPYDEKALRKQFPDINIDVMRVETNIGYYAPLRLVYDKYHKKAEYIGLMHNDLLIYEPGWVEKMVESFERDAALGLIGVCGSHEIDALGGRGAGTMVHFRGERGEGQNAGKRIHDLQASLILDSMFMLFRKSMIKLLEKSEEDWDNLPLGHFYDRIWPCRIIENGYRVATYGVECDHIGGVTMTANMRYRDDCIKWLEDRNMPYDNPETEMYLLAERRFLSEYRDTKKLLPAIIGPDYGIIYLAR